MINQSNQSKTLTWMITIKRLSEAAVLLHEKPQAEARGFSISQVSDLILRQSKGFTCRSGR